jgi:hypothetical protein
MSSSRSSAGRSKARPVFPTIIFLPLLPSRSSSTFRPSLALSPGRDDMTGLPEYRNGSSDPSIFFLLFFLANKALSFFANTSLILACIAQAASYSTLASSLSSSPLFPHPITPLPLPPRPSLASRFPIQPSSNGVPSPSSLCSPFSHPFPSLPLLAVSFPTSHPLDADSCPCAVRFASLATRSPRLYERTSTLPISRLLKYLSLLRGREAGRSQSS